MKGLNFEIKASLIRFSRWYFKLYTKKKLLKHGPRHLFGQHGAKMGRTKRSRKKCDIIYGWPLNAIVAAKLTTKYYKVI
jgi:hypothetical protein